MLMITRAVIAIVVFASLIGIGPHESEAETFSQTTTGQLHRVAEGIRPSNLGWLNQGLQVAFLDVGYTGRYVPIESESSWYTYDVEQGTLTQTNIWPAQPDIPATLFDDREPDSVAFEAPTGRYLTFMSRYTQDKWRESFVYVYDLQNDLIIDTGLPSGFGIDTVAFTEVIWSDESAFLLATTPIQGVAPRSILYYVDIDSGAYFQQLVRLEVENTFINVAGFHDISANGNQALLRTSRFVGVWNVTSPETVTIIPQDDVDGTSLLDAQFTQPDGSEFVYFNDDGIVLYNINSGLSEVLVENINTEPYDEARFAPTNDILALTDETSVYILDFRSVE